MISGFRDMSPSDKLHQVGQLTAMVRHLAMHDVRRRFPDADQRERELRVASRWISPDLMLRVFGWDVGKEGY